LADGLPAEFTRSPPAPTRRLYGVDHATTEALVHTSSKDLGL